MTIVVVRPPPARSSFSTLPTSVPPTRTGVREETFAAVRTSARTTAPCGPPADGRWCMNAQKSSTSATAMSTEPRRRSAFITAPAPRPCTAAGPRRACWPCTPRSRAEVLAVEPVAARQDADHVVVARAERDDAAHPRDAGVVVARALRGLADRRQRAVERPPQRADEGRGAPEQPEHGRDRRAHAPHDGGRGAQRARALLE